MPGETVLQFRLAVDQPDYARLLFRVIVPPFTLR